MKLNIRPLFYVDIDEAVAYLVEQAGAEVALRWADSVWETLDELKLHPRLGRERHDLPFPGIRSWRVKEFSRWLIFYGTRSDTLVFYRVKHGAMNLVKLDFDS